MHGRTLRLLEFDKILEQLARFTSFSVGQERVHALQPTDDIRLARDWQAETGEARRLLDEKSDIYLGAVHDLRPLVEQALRGSPILPADFISIRYTLQRAKALNRALSRIADRFPHVADVAMRMDAPQSLIDEIGRCIDERGEVLDSASDALGRIRRELREAHARLMERLQRIVASPGNQPYLQEAIVTQRQGRYVIPLRAEFKGRIPGLVHDQSGSGATLFIEPIAVVELNNRLREAQLAEEDEIRRILLQLTDMVAASAGPISRTVEALGDLDLVFAKARYANLLRASEPELVPFQVESSRLKGRLSRAQPSTLNLELATAQHPGSTIRLLQARHPLLDPLTVVPVDIYLDEDFFILVVTGPNTGGKTVTLKTTGLLTLMAQAGLAIPAAEGSKLSVFEQVHADIGDEQSIEQSLSTFSSHMTHIVEILGEADDRSLVLLDELGAGTDPEEGAALAQALLGTLLDRRITALATTHYSELKVFAHNTPFVTNASVEFDIETLSPTYRLSIGLPGRSNAFAIARRLGLPEPIVTRAEALVSPHSMEAETMLAEIKRARESAVAAESDAKAAHRRAEALNADLRYRLAKIEEARREVLSEVACAGRSRAGDAARRNRRIARAADSPRLQPARARRPQPARSLAGRSRADPGPAHGPSAAFAGRRGAGADRDRWSAPARRQSVGAFAASVRRGGRHRRPRDRGEGRRLPAEAGADSRRAAPTRRAVGCPVERCQRAQTAQPQHGARSARLDRGRHAGGVGSLSRHRLSGRAALRADHPRQGHRRAAPGRARRAAQPSSRR